MDFFTPMVDDPYIFGQIAAANALNDVYAMGGRPLLAMNLLMYPECDAGEELALILAGGLSKITEAGALLVGGHSVDDLEPKYGLAVTGLAHPAHLLLNDGARPGDVLFLSKPLGSGIVSTAVKAEMVDAAHVKEAMNWMSTLNRAAAEAALSVKAKAATDVTGFGLAGHLIEMAQASNAAIELYVDNIEWMKGAREAASYGLVPGGAYRNQAFYKEYFQYAGEIDQDREIMLYSPETAGGMLVAVHEDSAEVYQKQLLAAGQPCFKVGRVTGSRFEKVRVLARG